MGIYLNPGNVMFQESLNSMIYVDKTELIEYMNAFLNTKQKLICVSRPRRFGKSMALEMLAAYYSRECDSRQMFANLKIGHAEDGSKAPLENLNQYDVLFIDMQGILGMVMQDSRMMQELEEYEEKIGKLSSTRAKYLPHPFLAAVQRRLIRDIRENKEFAACIMEDETSLGNALLSVYRKTGRQFILLIDEWDSIFRNYEEDTLLQDKYIDMLRDLFKNVELLSVYALVYMTGILPIKRYGTQSALNSFYEYTMLDASPLGEFVGFTEQEALALYEQYDMDIQKAKEWYDGYQMKEVGSIYNPNSVVASIIRKRFSNYWTATGVYESVKKPIEMNFDGLKEDIITMLGNGRCKANTEKFQNDMVTIHSRDDVFTLLIHLGYLGYDTEKKEVYIPNKEIRDEFVNAIEGDKWKHTFEAISRSAELLEATLAGDEKTVAECIERVHEENTALLKYNDENALSCVIQIAYYQAQDEYMLIREMPAGKGFADVVFLPLRGGSLSSAGGFSGEKPAVIVELKWKQDVKTALHQIRERNYGGSLEKYYGEVLLVGISYDKETKKHVCKIEKVERER